MFVLVDMRDVAEAVIGVAAALPTESVSTYLQVLDLAAANGILAPTVHELSVDAIVNRWAEDDPRWEAPDRGGLTGSAHGCACAARAPPAACHVAARGRHGREPIQDLAGLVADAQQVGEAEALGLALQGRIEPGLRAVVMPVEERHRAPAEHA